MHGWKYSDVSENPSGIGLVIKDSIHIKLSIDTYGL